MTRLWMAAAEVDLSNVSPDLPLTRTVSGAGSVLAQESTVVRSPGRKSYKFDTGTSGVGAVYGTVALSGVNRTHYFRFYLNLPSIGMNCDILQLLSSGGSLTDPQMQVDASGFVGVRTNNTLQITAATPLVADTWALIEIKITYGATQCTAVELMINGESHGTWSGTGFNLAPDRIRFGFPSTPFAQRVAYWSDPALNDDQGASNNTWSGHGTVKLFKPTATGQNGSWTGGAGGTTNLFNAVNSTPPIGTATETDSTQIESVDTTGDNATDEYRGDCGSYQAAGIASGDIINAIQAWCNHGEDVATNSKTGSFGCQSNPSQTYDTFTFGADVGALGTYPSNWSWTKGTAQGAPSVTKTSSLVVAVRKTDNGSRVASVDFLGAYVDYTPQSAIPTSLFERRNPHRRTLQRM